MAAHRHFRADNGSGVTIQQNCNSCKQNGDLLVNTDCGFDLRFGIWFRLTGVANSSYIQNQAMHWRIKQPIPVVRETLYLKVGTVKQCPL